MSVTSTVTIDHRCTLVLAPRSIWYQGSVAGTNSCKFAADSHAMRCQTGVTAVQISFETLRLRAAGNINVRRAIEEGIKHAVVMYIGYECDQKHGQQTVETQSYTEIQFTTRPSEEQ